MTLSADDAARVRDLSQQATKLTYTLTALMEASAVITIVERTDLNEQVAKAMGHRCGLNDALSFDTAPIVCEVADLYGGRLQEALGEIQNLVTATEDTSNEQ